MIVHTFIKDCVKSKCQFGACMLNFLMVVRARYELLDLKKNIAFG